MSQKWGSNSKCNISAYVIVCYTITGHLSEGNIFSNARHRTSWKSESAKSPPVCVVGVGEGVGLDPYLSMAYQSGFHPGSCFKLILMNEIWASLWHLESDLSCSLRINVWFHMIKRSMCCG